MSLMGLIPKKPIDPGSDTEWVPDPPRTDPPSEIREVNSHASSPENL
jgi:hypothetical protein